MRYYALIGLFLFLGLGGHAATVRQYPKEGLASWYDPLTVATGEKYAVDGLTCALRMREFGEEYLVCNRENNKCMVVRHNDFGPSRELFNQGRIIDLSRYAFSKIADLKKGLIRVRIGQIHQGKVD